LPDSRKAVENKWIFKRKTDADGNVTVYKARLVAKGFRQIQDVDYDETFSPVAKLKSVRILLAIAAFFDYEIWQMDVKTAFLNGDIDEELYMREMNHIATGTAPSLEGELLPPHHGSSSVDEDGGEDGGGVNGEAFRGHFSVPAACRNRDSCPPDLGFAMAAALEGFAYRGLFVSGF
ncbi:hypothetical protein QYE76_031219, partial [Lolium multiflorum]